METVLIVGVTGQDGSYLSKLLLEKGSHVVGTSRDASVCDKSKLEKIGVLKDIELTSLAPNDFRNVLKIISTYKPSKIFNLSGQTSVGLSFDQPVECFDSIAGATLNFLEALRFFNDDIKFFNAGSSECFGNINTNESAHEKSSFMPRSPYAVAKSTAYWLVSNYRDSYNIFCCTGILSNHESPLRPERFVTQKIIKHVKEIKKGKRNYLTLGNVDIFRDWGWAPEYVNAIDLMLESDEPLDYIISSGSTHSLNEFVNLTFKFYGLNPDDHVRTNKEFIRPSDIKYSALNPKLIFDKLGWKSTKSIENIVENMIIERLF